MRNRSGFSLLEVVIAAAILAIILTTIYLLLFATDSMYQSETARRDKEFQLHYRMDLISQEARESSQSLTRTMAFNDALMPTPAQTLVVFISARDANGAFQVLNAKAEWQKLIVYAPYWNAQLGWGELRRYEVSPFNDLFKSTAEIPSITLDADNIYLEDVTVPRSGGETVLTDLDYLQVELAGSSFTLDLGLRSKVQAVEKVDLQSGVKGRN